MTQGTTARKQKSGIVLTRTAQVSSAPKGAARRVGRRARNALRFWGHLSGDARHGGAV